MQRMNFQDTNVKVHHSATGQMVRKLINTIISRSPDTFLSRKVAPFYACTGWLKFGLTRTLQKEKQYFLPRGLWYSHLASSHREGF